MRFVANCFVVFGLLFIFCPIAGGGQEGDQVPKMFVEKASEYVVQKMGSELFQESVRFAGAKVLKESPPAWAVFFDFTPSNGPWPVVKLAVKTSEKKPCRAWDNRPVPDCSFNNEFCQVCVSEEEAIAIAVKNGLERGKGELDVELRTVQGIDGLVWMVYSSIPKTAKGVIGYVATINATTGEFELLDILMEINCY